MSNQLKKGYFMVHTGITPVGIGEIIFLIIVVGIGLAGFLKAALKDD